MKKLVTGREMKLLDTNTSEHFHIPELVLMEQAAMVFVQKLFEVLPDPGKILIVCGTGNNGADGIAIARLLNQKGYPAEIFLMENILEHARVSESYSRQKEIYLAYGYPIRNTIFKLSSGESPYTLIIDAIFGIGLSRVVSGDYARIIELLNELPGKKAAVDISSGISAEDGAVLGTAFRADYTITFSFGKLGQFLWPGSEYCGTVITADMGITEESALGEAFGIQVLEKEDLSLLPARSAHSNKGTYGKLLIIAGSKNMAGAACLSAKAAYRAGAGLVRVLTCEENRLPIQQKVPEAVLSTYGENLDPQELSALLEWADGIVIGPGIGTAETARRLVEFVVCNAKTPVLFDADALNILSEWEELLEQIPQNSVFTPHLGEMSRLLKRNAGEIQQNLCQTAASFARKNKIHCVLKDFHTVVAGSNGSMYLNLSGNNGMATAGSGDVLTGIIGTFLAQGMEPIKAAALGVFVHGYAGDLILEKTGTYGMMAGDLIEGLNLVWNQVKER